MKGCSPPAKESRGQLLGRKTVEDMKKGKGSPPQLEREAGMLLGLPSKRKGVVQPAPDLQMFVGREGWFTSSSGPPPSWRQGLWLSPSLHAPEKISSPWGIGGRLIRPELSRFHRLINSFSGSRGRQPATSNERRAAGSCSVSLLDGRLGKLLS
jgi:hypothetical protein